MCMHTGTWYACQYRFIFLLLRSGMVPVPLRHMQAVLDRSMDQYSFQKSIRLSFMYSTAKFESRLAYVAVAYETRDLTRQIDIIRRTSGELVFDSPRVTRDLSRTL